jgi:hypothetical protein
VRPGFLLAVFVFAAVASAALTAYLVSLNRGINALLLFALIFGGVVVGAVLAFAKASHPLHRELVELIR